MIDHFYQSALLRVEIGPVSEVGFSWCRRRLKEKPVAAKSHRSFAKIHDPGRNFSRNFEKGLQGDQPNHFNKIILDKAARIIMF